MRSYGVDIGYGYTKVAGPDRPPIIIPSIVGSNEAPSYRSEIGDRTKMTRLSLDGRSYLIGEAARSFSRHHYRIFDSTWSESPYYLLLFVSALLRVEKNGGEPIGVVTGLPVNHYSKEKAEQMQSLLAKTQTANTPSGPVSLPVDKVKVIPQPFGSFYDMLLLPNGRLRDPKRLRESVGIVDIGFQTTDFALGSPHFVEHSSGSLEVGVRTITDQIARDINRKHSLSLNSVEAEQALRSRSMKLFGKSLDISDCIEERTREVAERIVSYTHTLWGRGQKLTRLVLTGGGANLFRPYFTEYPNLHVPENPTLANVRGYLKLARQAKW